MQSEQRVNNVHVIRVGGGGGSVLRLSTLWTAASLAVSRGRSAALTVRCVTGGPPSDWTVATRCTIDSDT